MKKLIAISMMIALVAGAAFAQEVQVGGALEFTWAAASNSGAPAADTVYATSLGESKITLSISDDEGRAGGRLTYKLAELAGLAHTHTTDGTTVGSTNPGNGLRNSVHNQAFIWWKPIEQVELFFGQDGDGKFNTADLSRWGYHRGTRGVSVENWDANGYLLGNWDEFGFALSVRPIDGLALHFAMNLPNPLGNEAGKKVDNYFDNIQIQASYAIPDIGTVYFTMRYFKDANSWDPGERVGLTFFSNSLVEGLAFEAGGNFNYASGATDTMRFLVGAHYTAGDWGARTRIYLHPRTAFFYLKADIMPWYDFGFMTAFCNIRIVTASSDKIGFHINPYVVKNVGPVQLRAGALFSDESGSGTVSWAIPIGMVVAF